MDFHLRPPEYPASMRTLPREFFCPRTGRFMREPVFLPSSEDYPHTCDRSAFDGLDIPHEKLEPDHELREKIKWWIAQHTPAPPFAFVSEPGHLIPAVEAIIAQYDRLELQDLWAHLTDLKQIIESKREVGSSAEAVTAVGRLLAGPDFDYNNPTDFMKEWGKISISLLSKANLKGEFQLDDCEELLEVLPKVAPLCTIDDVAFQLGLVNLLHVSLLSSSRDPNAVAATYVPVVGFHALHLSAEIPKSLHVWAKFVEIMEKLSSAVDSSGKLRCHTCPEFLRGFVKLGIRQLSWRHLMMYVLRLGDLMVPDAESSGQSVIRAGISCSVFEWMKGLQRDRATRKEKDIVEETILRTLYYICSTSVGRLDVIRILEGDRLSGSKGCLRAFYVCVMEHRVSPTHVGIALDTVNQLLLCNRYLEIFVEDLPLPPRRPEMFQTVGSLMEYLKSNCDGASAAIDAIRSLYAEIDRERRSVASKVY